MARQIGSLHNGLITDAQSEIHSVVEVAMRALARLVLPKFSVQAIKRHEGEGGESRIESQKHLVHAHAQPTFRFACTPCASAPAGRRCAASCIEHTRSHMCLDAIDGVLASSHAQGIIYVSYRFGAVWLANAAKHF
eukprot:5333098-Pleurochrysis_carterae.AAC.1